jgi:putative membrane protein insertion efficiency factor
MLKKVCIAIIRLYQYLISPVLKPSCRFIPTCSQYAAEAIEHYGPAKGILKAGLRILKCHPFHSGGYDPVIKIGK